MSWIAALSPQRSSSMIAELLGTKCSSDSSGIFPCVMKRFANYLLPGAKRFFLRARAALQRTCIPRCLTIVRPSRQVAFLRRAPRRIRHNIFDVYRDGRVRQQLKLSYVSHGRRPAPGHFLGRGISKRSAAAKQETRSSDYAC